MGAQQTALEHVCAAAQLGQAQHPLLQIFVAGLFQAVHQAAGKLLHPIAVQLGLFVQVLADLLLELLQLVQPVGQLEGAADGQNVVHDIQAEDEGRHRHSVLPPNAHQPPQHRRVHHMAQQHAAQTEENAVGQADAAVDLILAVGVVPPAHVEDGLHHPAGEVLQGRGQHHAREKRQNGVLQPAI